MGTTNACMQAMRWPCCPARRCLTLYIRARMLHAGYDIPTTASMELLPPDPRYSPCMCNSRQSLQAMLNELCMVRCRLWMHASSMVWHADVTWLPAVCAAPGRWAAQRGSCEVRRTSPSHRIHRGQLQQPRFHTSHVSLPSEGGGPAAIRMSARAPCADLPNHHHTSLALDISHAD